MESAPTALPLERRVAGSRWKAAQAHFIPFWEPLRLKPWSLDLRDACSRNRSTDDGFHLLLEAPADESRYLQPLLQHDAGGLVGASSADCLGFLVENRAQIV